MTDEPKVEVELMIEQKGLKLSLRSQVPNAKAEETLAAFLATIKSQTENINALSITPIKEAAYEAVPAADQPSKTIMTSDEPFVNMANDLGVSVEQLKNARIIGFKSGIDKPQLIGWAKFSPETGASLILYAFEIGLGRHSVGYEIANEVFAQCNYKVGPLANRALQNLKNQNKIDANRYQKSKELTLSPSGLEFARKELKKSLGLV